MNERARLVLAGALVACLLALLHAAVWRYPFLLDDYAFYDDAGRAGPVEVLLGSRTGTNYYRPLGRELYFGAGRWLLGPHPKAFRVVNFGLLLATAWGVMALAWRWGGLRAATLAGAAFAILGFHRVTLGWISGAQDLIAAALGVASAVLYLRGRRHAAAGAFFVGLFAKESIVVLPLVAAVYERVTGGRVRRALPMAYALALWAVVLLVLRIARGFWRADAGAPGLADVTLDPAVLLHGYGLALRALLGLDAPGLELADSWSRFRAPLAAFAVLGALVGLAWTARQARRDDGARPAGRTAQGLIFALAWTLLAAVPAALAGHHFSSYYANFAAAGFACGVGVLLANTPPGVSATALGGLLVLHTAALGARGYRVSLDDPGPRDVPYVSAARLEADARMLTAFERKLRTVVTEPGTDIVLYRRTRELAIAMGDDRAPRVWLDDPGVTLTVQRRFAAPPDARPRVFLRYDPTSGRFVTLPDSLAYGMVRGEALLAAGEWSRAHTWLARAIGSCTPGEHDLERVELMNSLGVAEAGAGDAALARRTWEEALRIDPEHAGASLNLAMLELADGDVHGARRRVLRVLGRDPGNANAISALEEIDRARREAAP